MGSTSFARTLWRLMFIFICVSEFLCQEVPCNQQLMEELTFLLEEKFLNMNSIIIEKFEYLEYKTDKADNKLLDIGKRLTQMESRLGNVNTNVASMKLLSENIELEVVALAEKSLKSQRLQQITFKKIEEMREVILQENHEMKTELKLNNKNSMDEIKENIGEFTETTNTSFVEMREAIEGYSGTWSGGIGPSRVVWAAKGSSVVLPCRLGQQGAETARDDWLNITWQRNNDTIESDRRHLLTKEKHLNITKVVHRRGRVTDEGEYRCLIMSSKGIVTSPPTNLYTATLSKNVVVSPTNVSVVEGESVRLTCQIDSHPPANLTWVHDQQSLPQDDRYTNPISGVLQINQVQQADSGSYKCLAENLLAVKKSRRSDGVILRVLPRGEGENYKAPSFLSPKDLVRVIQGQDVTIECFASGWPIPSISWQRKLNASQSNVWETVVAGGSSGITRVASELLHFTNANPNSHAGIYRCTASNNNPNNQQLITVTQDIPLDVLTPPVITEPPRQHSTVAAKTARLNCSASGHPPPHVTWYMQGKPVPIKGRILQHGSNQLVFTNSITSDTGLYQCLAINDAGYASSWAYMFVNSSKNQPDPPQNFQYVLLSPSSVLLSWDPVNPASGKVLKAYSIRYNEIDSGAMDQHAVSQSTSHLLERLKPDTNYTAHVRAYSNHASEPSEPLYFRTREDVVNQQ